MALHTSPPHIILSTHPIPSLIPHRMPDTVRTAAPSNFDASSCDPNIPLTNAVWRCTLAGYPTSLSFLTTRAEASCSSTTPVALGGGGRSGGVGGGGVGKSGGGEVVWVRLGWCKSAPPYR